jgi:hypothetical protein
MGTANTKSSAITLADESQPRVYAQSVVERGQPIVNVGTVEVAAADDNDSIYRLVRLPSGARVNKIELATDAIAGGTDYNLGLYKTAANGGAAVSESLFGDALDLSIGNTVPVEVTFDQVDLADIQKKLWELLALASDPHTEYDLALKGVTVGTGAGTISLRVEYVL